MLLIVPLAWVGIGAAMVLHAQRTCDGALDLLITNTPYNPKLVYASLVLLWPLVAIAALLGKAKRDDD